MADDMILGADLEMDLGDAALVLRGVDVVIDDALSSTSKNPVQNRVVKAALDLKANESALVGKQDKLTAGQNVTISGNVISADIDSAEIAANVTDWLDDNVTPVGSAVVVDSSLTVSGAAADAKVTGERLSFCKSAIEAVSEYEDSARQDLTPGCTVDYGGISFSYSEEDDSVTITSTNTQTWRGLGNTSFVQSLVPGRKYTITADCATVSGNPEKMLIVRGIQGNVYGDYAVIDFTNQSHGSVSFVATEYITAVFLLVTGATAAQGASVKYANIILTDDEALPISALDTKARAQISETDAELVVLVNATTDDEKTPVALTWNSTDGFYNKNGGFATYSGMSAASVSVTPGDIYFINGRSYYDISMAVYLDENDDWVQSVWVSGDEEPHNDVRTVVPSGAETMLVQRYGTYPTSLYKKTGITAKPVVSVLHGKRITLIGDSITEKNFTAAKNWAEYMGEWTGAIIQNLGASGTGFAAGNNNPYHNRITRVQSNADIIGVALSFNDLYMDIPVGTYSDTGTASLAGYANDFFSDLLAAFPTTPIICYVQSPWSAYHYGAANSDEFVDVVREICNRKGIAFYDDMYRGSVLRPWNAANRAVYYMNDGEGSTGGEDWVHPNSEGHKAIARALYPRFAENIVAIGMDYFS